MAEDLGSPLFGGDDNAHGGPSGGADFEGLARIQDASPEQRDMHGTAPDGDVDGYSEARWAGHDLTPAPATASGNAVAYLLATTPGLETYDERVADREDITDRTTAVADGEEEGRGDVVLDAGDDVSPATGVPLVTADDPSGPEGGDFTADPQAAVNFWGVVTERDDEGRVDEVDSDILSQDLPPDVVEAEEVSDGPVHAPEDEGVSAEDVVDDGDPAPTVEPEVSGDSVSYPEAERAEHGSEGDEPERRDPDIVDESAEAAGDGDFGSAGEDSPL